MVLWLYVQHLTMEPQKLLTKTYIRNMITKEQIIKTINALPDGFSSEELIQQIILLQKIDKGMQQSLQGQTVSNNEAQKRLSKWLK